MDITEKPTSPSLPDPQHPPGQSAAADAPGAHPLTGNSRLDRMPQQPRRNRFATHGSQTPATDPVDSVARTFSTCMKAIVCLLRIDSTLHLHRARLQLRLQVGRLIGPTPSEDVGNALRDLQRLHSRGYPVPAMDTDVPFKASTHDAMQIIRAFRRDLGVALAPDCVESAYINQSIALLDLPSD